MDNANEYVTMQEMRDGFLSKHVEVVNAHLFYAIQRAWTWGWVEGKGYFKKEKDDGNTLQG